MRYMRYKMRMRRLVEIHLKFESSFIGKTFDTLISIFGRDFFNGISCIKIVRKIRDDQQLHFCQFLSDFGILSGS